MQAMVERLPDRLPSDDIVKVDGNATSPAESSNSSHVRPSSPAQVCGWKGEAHY